MTTGSQHPSFDSVTFLKTHVNTMTRYFRSRFQQSCAACLLSLVALGQSSLFATDQTPGAKQSQPILLQGGTIHTVSGTTITNGSILFVEGKIKEVGSSIKAPDGTKIIDLAGKHVYPSLIEAHSQIGLVEIESVRATVDSSEIGQINPNVKAQIAFNPDSLAIPVARANGVLLAMTVPSGGLISGRSSLMQMDGWTWEDMALAKDVAMHVSWPRFAVARAGRRGGGGGPAAGAANDAQKRLQELKDWIDDTRIYAAGRELDPNKPLDARLEALIPVVQGKVPIMVDAEDAQQIQSAVAFCQQNQLKMIVYGGAAAEECSALLKAQSIPVIIAGVYRLPRQLKAYDESYTLPARLTSAGVRFCISGAGRFGASNLRNLPYHAATAVAYGLSAEDALRSITLSPAEILGVADKVGSLEAGKDATLFIANGDILEIATQVESAYVQGRQVDLSSHHTELYDKYRTKYERMKDR